MHRSTAERYRFVKICERTTTINIQDEYEKELKFFKKKFKDENRYTETKNNLYSRYLKKKVKITKETTRPRKPELTNSH